MCREFEFKALLSSIAHQITADELQTMRFLCSELISYPESRETQPNSSCLNEVFEFFIKLKTQNKLGIDDLELLKKMLTHLKKNDLLSQVTTFQSQRQSYLSTLSPDEREIESGNNQTTGSQRGESQAVANQTSRGALVMRCVPYLAGAAWAAGSVYILNLHKKDPEALRILISSVVLPTGNWIKSIFPGSINFLLQATDLNGLKELWKRYQSGRLKEDLQKVLVTEELKNLANGEPIDLVVTMSEKEYRNACLDLMVAQTKVHTLCQEITSPKLVRRISRSLPDLTSLDMTQDLSNAFILLAQLSDHLKKLKQNARKVEKTENVSSQSQQLKETSSEFEDKTAMDAEEHKDTLTSGGASERDIVQSGLEFTMERSAETKIHTKIYVDEDLNYFRLSYVFTRIVPEGLRTVFKQQWNMFYYATHGQWLDTSKNATEFKNKESPRNQRRYARHHTIMANGNTNKWNCTCLFYAILYSDCLGPFLNPTVKTNVDKLREIRNELFAHPADGRLTDVEFDDAMRKILAAFKGLGLDTTEIDLIKNQKSFLTDELSSTQQQLNDEKKRFAKFSSFCVLPPKPSHDTTDRADEVKTINHEMEKLRSTKKNETTIIYLSGNPGCGKSEIARQIGHEYFDKIPEEEAQLKFVFTFNASSINTLLQSYFDFAIRLSCDEDVVTRTVTSKDLSEEEKINQMKSLINPKVQIYSSWLIIVDNVNDLRAVSKYLPQAGEKTSGDGQILVTTQDSQAIPRDPYTYHYPSLKEGMKEDDAITLLAQISGITGDRDTLLSIASALDFQPLALACAAAYMQQVFHYTDQSEAKWEKYLLKLQEGKREATEKAFVKTIQKPGMTTAVKLALERVADKDKDKIMMHAFQFLSVITNEPIPLKYVVRHVMNCMPDEDQDLVAVHISSRSLVISSEDVEMSKAVRVHQVVYHGLQKLFGNDEIDIMKLMSVFSDLPRKNVYEEMIAKHFLAISTKLSG